MAQDMGLLICYCESAQVFNGQKPENSHSFNLHEHEMIEINYCIFLLNISIHGHKQTNKRGNLSFGLAFLTQRPERANEQTHICY